MKILTYTNAGLLNSSILILRLFVGIILFVVGAGKAVGWFGGGGLQTSLQFYTSMGIAPVLAYLSIFVEFIGGFFLIIGLLTRLAALGAFINLVVAAILSLPVGIFYAVFPLSLAIMLIPVMLTGPLNYSFDYLIEKKSKNKYDATK